MKQINSQGDEVKYPVARHDFLNKLARKGAQCSFRDEASAQIRRLDTQALVMDLTSEVKLGSRLSRRTGRPSPPSKRRCVREVL